MLVFNSEVLHGNYSRVFSTVSPNEIVSVDPSIIIANYNDNAMFTCLTDAGPSNMYEWLVNATDLVCTQLNCSDGIFSFNVTDEGKKAYKCTVQTFN